MSPHPTLSVVQGDMSIYRPSWPRVVFPQCSVFVLVLVGYYIDDGCQECEVDEAGHAETGFISSRKVVGCSIT